ncbi:hypothetical protein LB505_006928 [Fusarium chuoi]|nr:hypothetical protein LB505_006928 [Fusarium chuoi]
MPSARTNLGPLTTEWKYPDRCTVPVTDCSSCMNAWQGQTCGNNKDNTAYSTIQTVGHRANHRSRLEML